MLFVKVVHVQPKNFVMVLIRPRGILKFIQSIYIIKLLFPLEQKVYDLQMF